MMLWIKRAAILFIRLLVMAFDAVISIKASLGTSPISSLPYVVSIISLLSVGTATIIMHACASFFKSFY